MKIETKDEAIHYFKKACNSRHFNKNQITKNFHINSFEIFYDKNLLRVIKGHPQSLITEKGLTKVQEEKKPKIMIFPHADLLEPIKGISTFELTESECNELEQYYLGENTLKEEYHKTEQPAPKKESKIKRILDIIFS